jgi:hypothetical protein
MDADLQKIVLKKLGLYNMITSQNFDLVSGWRSATILWFAKTYLQNSIGQPENVWCRTK